MLLKVLEVEGEDDSLPEDAEADKIAEYKSKCCDKIHIVYDDFNQNDKTQPYKRYKVTYYALARVDGVKRDMQFINLKLDGNKEKLMKVIQAGL